MRANLIAHVAHCQMMLENMDKIKTTPLYKQNTKSAVKTLSKLLENELKGELGKGFVEDSKEFFILMNGIEAISGWMASREDFDEIMVLARNLKTDIKIYSIEDTIKTGVKERAKALKDGKISIEEFDDFVDKLM